MGKFAIGHVLIKTSQLARAVNDFEKLGFTVSYRTDPSKAHNAMIYFQNGSFLEIYDPKPINLPNKLILGLLKLLRPLHREMINRLIYYIKSEDGINDYALDSVPSGQAEANVEEMRQAGVKLSKKINISKRLRDGNKQTWWMAMPQATSIPFFMSDYIPHTNGHANEHTHANDALGIDTLVIDVPDLERWVAAYRLIFTDSTISKQNDQCQFTLEKQYKIVLRKAQWHRISELHLLSANKNEDRLTIATNLAYGAAIFIN
ncbi:VOC family protein [Paenibacillus sinopodophylli]|uniref:VOC family protein n=1 Tax=Paenibacillus sinopodophylli TaxID=1837342 RepID=UPI00110D0697|nr:VOC family protein [Paenibacillus sinopodophylli]